MDQSSSTVFGLQCSNKIKAFNKFYEEILMNFKNLKKNEKMQHFKSA